MADVISGSSWNKWRWGNDNLPYIAKPGSLRGYEAVNAELIQMYWEIGAYVSERVKDGGWGKSIVADFSAFLQTHYPTVKGFSAQNIWRMKQFYETYCDNEKLSPLVRVFPWTNNLLIMAGCKTDEDCLNALLIFLKVAYPVSQQRIISVQEKSCINLPTGDSSCQEPFTYRICEPIPCYRSTENTFRQI